MNTPEASITYAVQYQHVDSGEDDWYIMHGRDHNERTFKHPGDGMDETTSMDEAVEIAKALVTRRSYPHDPKEYYYKPVTRARVVTRVSVGHISAVYEAR